MDTMQGWRRAGPFLFLSFLSVLSAVGFSLMQERVFRVDGFHYGGWAALWTMITYHGCSRIERSCSRDAVRRSKMKNYFILATVTLGGMYFTNWSLEYLNYTTRIVFKSSKVLPTMMFGTLLQKKRYFFFEYMGGTLLVMGIVLFSMGDHEGMPNFNPVGLALITVGVCCDTVTSNLEEKVFFRRENPISQAEILCFSSMIGSAYLTIILVATGELKDGYQHAIEHVEVIPLIVASSVLGYVSVSLILLLINHYGATNAEIVKSSRKILQVLASFIVFPKTPNYKYAVGAVSVILGIMLLGHYQVKNPTEVYNSKQAQEKEKQGAAERQHYKPEADIL